MIEGVLRQVADPALIPTLSNPEPNPTMTLRLTLALA